MKHTKVPDCKQVWSLRGPVKKRWILVVSCKQFSDTNTLLLFIQQAFFPVGLQYFMHIEKFVWKVLTSVIAHNLLEDFFWNDVEYEKKR